MRLVAALLIALFAVAPVAAQNEDAREGNGTPQASPGSKFRKPSPARVKARSATRKQPDQARGAAASPKATAARKRPAPAHPGTARAPSAAPPADEGLLIQSELAWIGEYIGPLDGKLSEKTAAAIKSFQRNRKFRETGVLNTQQRVLLATAAKARQAQVGWTMVDDPVTGARLGLPGKQVPNRTQSKSSTRWSSAQGEVQVETFRIREPGLALAAVFERQTKMANRKVETSELNAHSFVLSGTQGLKKFHVRADIRDGEVRGMTVLYDPSTETTMAAVAVVMSNAFTAFPGVTGAVQAGVPPPKRNVEYGTGIVASAVGHILTDRQLTEGCNVIVVSGYGNADLLAEDPGADLALVRVYGAPDLAPAALATDSAHGPDAVLVGIADPQNQGGGNAISTATAQLRDNALDPPPQLGFTGAAVLDRESRFLGMVQLRPQVVANIGTPTLQSQANIVPAQTIRAFLESRQLHPASGQNGVEAAKASLVRVICVRK
jgi:peptidoglycan hydrolase-like protein with peptidoglycan-binding domain